MRYLKCSVLVLILMVVGCVRHNVVPVTESESLQLRAAVPKVKHPEKLYLYGSIVSDGVVMNTHSTTTTWIESGPVIVVKLENGVIHVDKIAIENADVLRSYSLRQGDILRYRIIHKEGPTAGYDYDDYVLVAKNVADIKKD